MNKNLLDQLPADEQPLAAQLQDAAAKMQVSPAFEMELENQLMEKYKNRTQPSGWFMKLTPALGWAFAAVCAVFVLNWTFRSLVPGLTAASAETPTAQITFEERVRAGDICPGPLAVAHNFSVAVTNADKTAFIPIEQEETAGELRSFIWSTDGEQLAMLGNTFGTGSIYLTDSKDPQLMPLVTSPDFGYIHNFAWSRDGKQFALLSGQNTKIFLVNADGTGLVQKQLGMQILGTPQFSPDGASLLFLGADASSFGLFEFTLDTSQTRLISSLVENAGAFAWSPDGTRLAYFLADRTLGEALLVTEEFNTGEKAVIATLPIPKGSGSSIPEVANLSWSQDGNLIAFEFGRGVADRAVYLAYADGSGLVKVTDSGHAPTTSSDGNCLAYISNKQVFLVDLTDVSLDSPPPPSLLLADLPTGRSPADFRLDQLQWQP